jgi:cytochrome c biogenesis protein
MTFLKNGKSLKLISNLYFAICLLVTIAFLSSLGSFIEQDESILFYQENYPLNKPIYGFINWEFITFLGIDHIYKTWWFYFLLFLLGSSLISCTIVRQFPLFLTSKDFFFKKEKKSFFVLPFFRKIKNVSYIKENIIVKIQNMNFYIFQKGNLIYGYKGLIGRISPILVHFSLLLILIGSSFGAIKNFKAQEILPKGEIFHIQNPIGAGWFTSLPTFNIRVNDFWVEYQNRKIHQFYSNLSILDNLGNEINEQTISVNNPLRYKNIDFYQSDWNLVGIRIKKIKNEYGDKTFNFLPIQELKKETLVLKNEKIYEIPLFKKESKSWITWINILKETKQKQNLEIKNNEIKEKNYTIVFDQFQNNFLIFDLKGNFLGIKNIGEKIENDFLILDIIPSTGLLVKYDPSIPIIYFGFALLMVTSSLSFLPYTQLWVFQKFENSWIGGTTNRGKIQLEIEFENLIRHTENLLLKSGFFSLKKKEKSV